MLSIHRRSLLILLSCALLPALTPVRANLGETLEQALVRYGKPQPASSPATGTCIFYHGKYRITALFYKKIIISEFIVKRDGSTFSEPEQIALLQKEATGGKWIQSKSPSAPGTVVWEREDRATAVYTAETKTPTLTLSANDGS